MNGEDQTAATEEPGAQDNLLSLDPNDPKFEFAADWQDGEEYNIKNLRVRQISPGQFEPVSGEAGEPVNDAESTDEDTAETGAAAAPGANGRNPAIREAIARRYK